MRVFFIGAHLPLAGHSVRAPTVVIREALAAFRALGHEVVFQPLLSHDAEEGFEAEGERALEWAHAHGVELLPALYAQPDAVGSTPRLLLRQAFSSDAAVFYPSYALRKEMAKRVDSSDADVCFHLWSSAAFGACAEVETPIFAYAGNPDHYSMAARLKHPALFAVPQKTLRNRLKLILWRRAYRRFEDVVVRLALRSTWIGCASAPNADYYTAKGHPRAFYLQNMWPELAEGRRDAAEPTGDLIAGNLGGQYATGNTFGGWLLATEVLPALDRLLGDDYEVRLYGAGRFSEPVARALDRPHVTNSGFVDDIDAELQAAKVFLLCNNANPDFVVGHTPDSPRVVARLLPRRAREHGEGDARDRARRKRVARKHRRGDRGASRSRVPRRGSATQDRRGRPPHLGTRVPTRGRRAADRPPHRVRPQTRFGVPCRSSPHSCSTLTNPRLSRTRRGSPSGSRETTTSNSIAPRRSSWAEPTIT